jgi:ATP-dependent DNA helicase RecG
MGIFTGRDLVEYFPRALEDAEVKTHFSQIVLDEKNTLEGELHHFRIEKTRYGKKLAKALLSLQDGTVEVVWFAMPYNLKNFEGSRTVYLVGKVKRNYGKISLQNPEVHFEQNIHIGHIRPIYPESPPITSKWLREKISGLSSLVRSSYPEFLPSEILDHEKLMPRHEAIEKIHFPPNIESWKAARFRLGFEEILLVQLRVLRAKKDREKQTKNRFLVPFQPEQTKTDFQKIPFQLTNAQKKALLEILQDFSSHRPMHRLLQGDVGAGKTVVAFLSCLPMIRAGFQCCILAPTEILAQQHFASAQRFFRPFFSSPFAPEKTGSIQGESLFPEMENPTDQAIACLRGSTPAKEKKSIKARLKNGTIKILIGTHALLTEDTIFEKLGLAVIDEQHRFGVKQRAILSEGLTHTLSMTATPIPRSLALTIYGDQDLSIINEKPAGRKPIITRVIADESTRQKMQYFIDDQIGKGRQIFWVCPLVDESDKIEARNVKAEYDRIAQEVFPNRKVAFLHGKMRPKEKATIMTDFSEKKFDILVSTSVIEVGVDIPNATVMVIENSERFGLAQLHQFRGRIGRNDYQSYCFLMVDKKEDRHKERLKAMEKSNDGFYLSEVDLKLRGAGEIYGLRQSGIPDFKCADIHDVELMKSGRDWAEKILKADPSLEKLTELKSQIEAHSVYF